MITKARLLLLPVNLPPGYSYGAFSRRPWRLMALLPTPAWLMRSVQPPPRRCFPPGTPSIAELSERPANYRSSNDGQMAEQWAHQFWLRLLASQSLDSAVPMALREL